MSAMRQAQNISPPLIPSPPRVPCGAVLSIYIISHLIPRLLKQHHGICESRVSAKLLN